MRKPTVVPQCYHDAVGELSCLLGKKTSLQTKYGLVILNLDLAVYCVALHGTLFVFS